jgi:hypothetical protein
VTISAISRPGERDRLVVKLGQIDWTLCLLLCAITGIGAVMLYSIAGGAWSPWAGRHLILFGVCFALMIAMSTLDLRVWFALAYPVYGLGLLMLLAVAVVGHSTMGAQRWLDVGPIRIQPSEIIKIGLVMALARYYHGLSATRARWSWSLLIPAALIGAPAALVAHQPDLGTAVLIAATGGLMMILAGLSLRVVAVGLLGLGAVVPLAFAFVLKGYQRTRLLTFLNPEADRSGAGYHIIQSEIALGSGGLLGKGLGLGTQSQLNLHGRGTRFSRLRHGADPLRRGDPGHPAHRHRGPQPLRADGRLRRGRHPGALCADQRRHGHGPRAGGGRAHAAAVVWRHGDDHHDAGVRDGPVGAGSPLFGGDQRQLGLCLRGGGGIRPGPGRWPAPGRR